jgi:XTP/dITP diphosphohydrolase
MHTITLVTSNAKKAEQFSRWLGLEVKHVAIDLPELQTMDMEVIVRAKAEAAYAHLKRPVIVEDTSLGFHAIKGLPGPFTKFFLTAGGPELLCRVADLHDNRRALYSVWVAYRDEHGTHVVHGDIAGSISSTPSAPGAFGFGFDQCFVPDGETAPRAMLDVASFERSSARKKAIDALRAWLATR